MHFCLFIFEIIKVEILQLCNGYLHFMMIFLWVFWYEIDVLTSTLQTYHKFYLLVRKQIKSFEIQVLSDLSIKF